MTAFIHLLLSTVLTRSCNEITSHQFLSFPLPCHF